VPGGQVDGQGLLIDGGAVERVDPAAGRCGPLFGLGPELAGQGRGAAREVVVPDVLLVQVAVQPAGAIEQAGLADEPEAVEPGQGEAD
jgi:hypothetical protein